MSNYDLSYSTSSKIVGWDYDIAETGKILDMEARNKEALDKRIQTFLRLVTYIRQVLSSTYYLLFSFSFIFPPPSYVKL
jgi:hypothetical protein